MTALARVAVGSPAGRSGGAELEVAGLRIAGRIGGVERTLVARADLTVRPGEAVGIVGESGSGKSLTARAIMGLLPPALSADGEIRLSGRDLLKASERELARIRGSEIALVLQDPFTMLNPLQRCGKHVEEGLPRAGRRSRHARREEVLRRLAEVGIRDPRVADRYPFELSGGMRQRVGIAAALARDPRLLIADEPTTALDASTQSGILALLRSLQRSRGMGLILVTHDLRVVFGVCDRIYVLYAGSIVEAAPAPALDREPLHPYTLGLLMSEPSIEHRGGTLATIEGRVPAPDEVLGVCPFSTRCGWVTEECRRPVAPRAVGGGRLTSCVRIDAIRESMHERRATSRSNGPQPARRPDTAIVSVENLSKVFSTRGRGGHDVVALDDVSLRVGEGESVGLVGESGSGKTTLARILVGLETADSGSLEIDGVDVTSSQLTADERRHLNRTIQIVFQDPYSSLNPARTVGAALAQAVRMGATTVGRKDLEREVAELLRRVGLPAAYADRKPVGLSGGERQRVAIARALAVRPRILVCDEPVSALDVSVQAQILNLLQELRDELRLSCLFITHDLAVVRQCVDYVYVLYQGEVVEEQTVDGVLDSPRHPYTRQLVDAALGLEPVVARRA